MGAWRRKAMVPAVSLALFAGIGCSGGAGSCHDDKPPLSSMFEEGGSSCTLPDGRPGLGDGQYGCIDPTVCHCRPEAGPAACAAGAVCVYSGCTRANPGATCALPGGGSGTCCNGACSAVDLRTDPSNCGGCGFVCPSGVSCDYGGCSVPYGASPACPSGTVLAHASCVSSTCQACVASSCTGLTEGAPCALPPIAGPTGPLTGTGICCHDVCVAPDVDDQNCGGCGVACCPGTSCGTADPYGITTSLGIVGWCV